MSLTVRPISAAEHLAFVRTQRSVSFLQTPAWGGVKTEWRSESLGWFEGRQLVGAGLVLHRPVPRLERFTLAYLPQSPAIDWAGELDAWLDPLAAYLKEHGAFAIRLGPPVRTNTWSAAQVKEGIADPGIDRLTEMPGQAHPVGARVTSQLRDAGWVPQSPEDGFGTGQPQFTYELPLAGKSESDLLKGMNQLWRRNIKKAAKEGVEVTAGEDLKSFHDLYVHTAERDHFTPRPLRYFETMFAALSAEDPERIRLYLRPPPGRPGRRHHPGARRRPRVVLLRRLLDREARGARLQRLPMGDDPRLTGGRLRCLRPARHHPHP